MNDRNLVLRIRNGFKGCASEIMAGGVLHPKTEAEVSWNRACQRAIRLIGKYVDGDGLLQDDYEQRIKQLEEGR